MENVIKYFEGNGYRQSHTATESGCVFERWDDDELVVILINADGWRLASARFDKKAVKAGAASATAKAFYDTLNGAKA